MTDYVFLVVFALGVGVIFGRAIERATWVWRTDHLDICEHATPRCHQCNLRRNPRRQKEESK